MSSEPKHVRRLLNEQSQEIYICSKMATSNVNDGFLELEQSTQHLKDFKLAIEFKYLVSDRLKKNYHTRYRINYSFHESDISYFILR